MLRSDQVILQLTCSLDRTDNEFRISFLLSHSIFFIYFDKATKACKISTLLLSVCSADKNKVEIQQNFVAFSEYMNFTSLSKESKGYSHLSNKPCTNQKSSLHVYLLISLQNFQYSYRTFHILTETNDDYPHRHFELLNQKELLSVRWDSILQNAQALNKSSDFFRG